MSRWFSRRWAWAALAGAGLAVGLAAGRADGESPPKVGAVLSLNIDGKGERQFKVVKSEKQPDGAYLSELKDTKSGETITLYDKPGENAPAPPPPASAKAAESPKSRPSDAGMPPMPRTASESPKGKEPEKEKERRTILNRIFGDRDKDKEKFPAAGEAMKAEPPAEGGKKPGIIGRIFGPKKPSGPSMPATQAPAPNFPAPRPVASSPPPVIPTPPGGLTGALKPPPAPPPVVNTAPPAFPGTAKPANTAPPAFPGTTNEPPRVMPPLRPATPPSQSAPVPLPPASAPSFPTPMPMPGPVSTPAPAVPAVPSVPAPLPSIPSAPGIGLPPIPVPPGGTSFARPVQAVIQAGYAPASYVPARIAYDREVQPWVISLQTMTAPSARLTAARALAECRHRSTDGVKGVLFQAARVDPCGEVRAACITHLCDLGYFHPQFLGYIQAACNDTDALVRDAATVACAKMLRR